MDHHVNRREFLKAATAASSALACVGATADAIADAETGAADDPAKITDRDYVAVADYPIQPAPFWDVTLEDNFWKPKVDLNAKVTIPFEVRKLMATPRGLTGNVLEAAMCSLKTHPDAALQRQVDAAVDAAQRPHPREGNSGFEAAVTWASTTGDRALIRASTRIASALYDDFVLHDPPFSGGERDAINCVQLYRATHDVTHLALAKHYLDIRGRNDSVNRSRHNQSYKPVLEQNEAVGHAVNCASLMVSLAEVGVLTGRREYFRAAERMWSDAVTTKMYITGGIGSTGNEGFGEPYALPNISAYAETCAVLMFMTLNHRLFLATGDSRYIDVLERGMYNNAIDGVSAAGDRFFYVNRLASAGDGRDLRWQHASLECCPPNLVRFLASMPGFIYAQDPAGSVFVNLYVSGNASFTLEGNDIRLSVQSEMPWGGASTITVSTSGAVRGAIKLRIPGWARNRPAPGGLYSYANRIDRQTKLSINQSSMSAVPGDDGYVTLDRVWKDRDVVRVEFPVEIRTVIANPKVRACVGRVALERGPIVYCAEWPDVEGGHVADLVFDTAGAMTIAAPGPVGGAPAIQVRTRRMGEPAAASKMVTLIPYHLWANRGAGEMSVWLPAREYAVGDIGPAGGAIVYVNPAPAAGGWRFLEAAPADQSGGAKWGCFRRAIAGARGTAIGTGRQNTADMLADCDEAGTAAALCASYRVNGVAGWFLPSRDELALVHRHLASAGLGNFFHEGAPDNVSYWSSSQNDADMAAHIDFADNGRQHVDDKDFPRRVRAIRAF
jgi:uncharacterized protein